MELVWIASLASLGFVANALLWHILVHPGLVVSLWEPNETVVQEVGPPVGQGTGADPLDGATDDGWTPLDEADVARDRQRRAAIRGLRWTLSAVVLLVGFLTGVAVTFLART